ncbi:MAG TPA: hypothetical protein VIH61_00490 [Waddliaceae bacterium]
MGKENTLVFVTPILDGKTNTLKEQLFYSDEEALLRDLKVSKYHRWIQSINDTYFLVHQIEGENLQQSFDSLKEKISQGNSTAIGLQNLYKDSLGIDIEKDNWIPQLNELTEFMDMHIENLNGDSSKEYCFVYPVLFSKKEKLLKLYEDKAVYYSEPIQNIYRFRGIDKTQIWLQESFGNIFIVVYQEIIGSVAIARDKYLNSKEDALSKYLANLYSEITGLPYEQLLPSLESLDDAEILH